MMPCFVTMGFSRRFFLCAMNKDLVAREAVHALVQWPSLRNLSDQLNRRQVETCLLLFFGQVLLRILTAARCELLASLPPLLCQPGNDQRKPWGTPYLRIVGCFRVVNCLRDVFLRIWDNPFGSSQPDRPKHDDQQRRHATYRCKGGAEGTGCDESTVTHGRASLIDHHEPHMHPVATTGSRTFPCDQSQLCEPNTCPSASFRGLAA